MTAAVKRGDVYWVTPEDGGGSVAHPHVVVQEDVFNRSRVQTVIVCALTTNLKRATEPGNVLLDIGEGSLNKQSVVVVSQVSSVSKASLGERIGNAHQRTRGPSHRRHALSTGVVFRRLNSRQRRHPRDE
jgi:mRNA interferase MazF